MNHQLKTSESTNENGMTDERTHVMAPEEQKHKPSRPASQKMMERQSIHTSPMHHHRNMPSITFLTLILSMIVAVVASAMEEYMSAPPRAGLAATRRGSGRMPRAHEYSDGGIAAASYNSENMVVMSEEESEIAHNMHVKTMESSSFEAMMPPEMPSSSAGNRNDENTLGAQVLQSLSQQETKVNNDNNGNNEIVTPQMLVHTGDMEVQSNIEHQVQDDAAQIVQSLEEIGGYIESRSMYIEHLYYKPHCRNYNNVDQKKGKCGRTIISLNARIPSAQFFAFQDTIQQMFGAGNILSISTSSRDVSTEYIDANARAGTLEQSRVAIESILRRANTVREVMDVQRELNRVTQQLESNKSRAIYLKKSAELSKLTIRLKQALPEEDVSPSPSDDGPKGWDPKDAFKRALKHLSRFFHMFGDLVVYAMVWFIPCFICLQLGAMLVKKLLLKRGQEGVDGVSSATYSPLVSSNL